MSLESLTACMYHSRAKGTEKLVLIGIANLEGEHGAYPSIATLARYANVDERNVRRALARLVELGEISIEIHGGAGRKDRKTNLYRVLVTCPPGCSGGFTHVVHEGAETPGRQRHGGAPAPADIKLLVTSSSSDKAVTPSGVTSLSSLREEIHQEDEEFISMPWPGFEDSEAAPQPKRKRREPEPETGAVGKIEDKRAKRQEKYTRTKIEAVSPAALRSERPESEWTTNDLVAEFYALTRVHAPGIVSQVNGGQLASWINRQVGQGVPRPVILRALRDFFEDQRNTHDAGHGKPLWRRFVAYFPSVQVLPTHDYESSDEKELMAKMEARALRELGVNT